MGWAGAWCLPVSLWTAMTIWRLGDCVNSAELCKLWSLCLRPPSMPQIPIAMSIFSEPCFSGVCFSLEHCCDQETKTSRKGDGAGIVWMWHPHSHQAQGCRMGDQPVRFFQLLPLPCWGFGSSWTRGSSQLPMRSVAGGGPHARHPLPCRLSRGVLLGEPIVIALQKQHSPSE